MKIVSLLITLLFLSSCNVENELKGLWVSKCQESASLAFEKVTLAPKCNGQDIVSTILRAPKSKKHKVSIINYLKENFGLNINTYREPNTDNTVDFLIAKLGSCTDIKSYIKYWGFQLKAVNNQYESILFALMSNPISPTCEIDYQDLFRNDKYLYSQKNIEGKTAYEMFIETRTSVSSKVFFFALTRDARFLDSFHEDPLKYILDINFKKILDLVPLIPNIEEIFSKFLINYNRDFLDTKTLDEILAVHSPSIDISVIYRIYENIDIRNSLIRSNSKITYNKKILYSHKRGPSYKVLADFYNLKFKRISSIAKKRLNRRFVMYFSNEDNISIGDYGNNNFHEFIKMKIPYKVILKLARNEGNSDFLNVPGRDDKTVLELAKDYNIKLYNKLRKI